MAEKAVPKSSCSRKVHSAIERRFFDFFRNVSRETIGVESICGKHLSKSGLKHMLSCETSLNKSKNIARERHKITKY